MASVYLNDERVSKAQNIALWMLQIVASVIFFLAGFILACVVQVITLLARKA